MTLSDNVLFGAKLAAAFVASVVNVNQPGDAPAPGGQEVVNTPPGPGETGGGPGETGGGPGATSGPGGSVEETIPVGTQGSEGVADTGGSGGGGGGGEAGGGSAGGKELPFTGMAVALTAGVGVALAGAGAKLRSLAGRQPGDDA